MPRAHASLLSTCREGQGKPSRASPTAHDLDSHPSCATSRHDQLPHLLPHKQLTNSAACSNLPRLPVHLLRHRAQPSSCHPPASARSSCTVPMSEPDFHSHPCCALRSDPTYSPYLLTAPSAHQSESTSADNPWPTSWLISRLPLFRSPGAARSPAPLHLPQTTTRSPRHPGLSYPSRTSPPDRTAELSPASLLDPSADWARSAAHREALTAPRPGASRPMPEHSSIRLRRSQPAAVQLPPHQTTSYSTCLFPEC